MRQRRHGLPGQDPAHLRAGLIVLGAALAACAGDPAATPTPTGTASPRADFAYVNEEILVRSCAFSGCHGTGPVSAGLRLTAEESYANLVGVASTEVPSMMRVAAGDADHSYLVWKLEGTEGITDDPMPPPTGGLEADKIASIRAWIEAGALAE